MIERYSGLERRTTEDRRREARRLRDMRAADLKEYARMLRDMRAAQAHQKQAGEQRQSDRCYA